MRIVQFGLPYSPNLGDGVIAECFAHGVGQVVPGADVRTLDLSGRTDFGETVVTNRRLALAALRRMPCGLRHRVVAARLGRILDAAEPRWRAALDGADLAVIGGGQLFSDADLNFPLKVARAARLAREADVPLAVHAAGVARNWSRRGATLYEGVLAADLRAVGLRDGPSISAWQAQMRPGGPAPLLTPDPGLLAAGRYGAVTADDRIGLCVADPAILAYHGDGGRAAGCTYFAALARALLAEGHSLRLFCNGAAEDAAALDALGNLLSADLRAGRAEIAPTPSHPRELAALTASCRAVIAHRLHACILAVAYGRQAVGLGWDRKVQSFFEGLGAADRFVPAGAAPAEAASRLARALEVGADPSMAAQAGAGALDGIRAILDRAAG